MFLKDASDRCMETELEGASRDAVDWLEDGGSCDSEAHKESRGRKQPTLDEVLMWR